MKYSIILKQKRIGSDASESYEEVYGVVSVDDPPFDVIQLAYYNTLSKNNYINRHKLSDILKYGLKTKEEWNSLFQPLILAKRPTFRSPYSSSFYSFIVNKFPLFLKYKKTLFKNTSTTEREVLLLTEDEFKVEMVKYQLKVSSQ